MKYQMHQTVKYNGNPDGKIVEVNQSGYVVRLFDGLRIVGDVQACEASLDAENN